MATKSQTAKRSKHILLDLQKRRKDRGLTLETIADTTKISIRFLRAIEDEDFDQLPGGIFNTSYLRQYAAAIGTDQEQLLAHYSRATASDPRDSGQGGAPNRGLRRWLGITAVVGR